MRHPGYQLNPGDLFAVDVDTVLWATGLPKQGQEQALIENDKEDIENEDEVSTLESDSVESKSSEDVAELSSTLETNVKIEEEEDEDLTEALNIAASDSKTIKENKKSLENVRQIIDEVIEKINPSSKRKQELRAIRKQIPRLISRLKHDDNPSEIQTMEGNLQEVLEKIETATEPSVREETSDSPKKSSFQERKDRYVDPDGHISALAAAYNEFLPDRSYAQPWQPRDWMAPFAFVPRYLEVNYNICSAVYLRHPVARPGLSEVPTPFHQEIGGLAHNWYLRRR